MNMLLSMEDFGDFRRSPPMSDWAAADAKRAREQIERARAMKKESEVICQTSREMIKRSRAALERSYRILGSCPIEVPPAYRERHF